MSNDTNSSYGYDPFSSSGTGSRWGRRAPQNLTVPEIANYEIIDTIGSGGMGSVWSAKYLPLNQTRAVKVLDKALAVDATFVERFSQEAKALGRLEHPNIVKVFDANADHRPPYIAMQWVEGKTLSQLLSKSPMPLATALPWFEQIAGALDYAHSNGFIHRDIKPSNVMITDAGMAMLIDFGVASWMGSDPSTAHTITGTTRYLAPEVIEGRPVTASSDVWAFGVLIYRTLTGHLPFDDPNGEIVLKKIVGEAPADAREAGRLRKFLMDMLEKDPKKRYKTAGELVAALRLVSLAWVPKVKGESVVAGSAMTILGGVGVLVLIGGGMMVVSMFNRPKTPSLAAVSKETKALISSITGKDKKASPVGSVAPLAKDLKGPWFADLGTRWIEAYFDPAGGPEFRVVEMSRTEQGTVTVRAQGSLDEDGKGISFAEKEILANPANIPYTPGSFKGTFSEDRARVAGTLGDAAVRFVRASDVGLSPYDNPTLQFNTAIPEGWATAQTSDDAGATVSFSPLGNPSVLIRVVIAPETEGANLDAIFGAREAILQNDKTTGGDYQRLTFNPDTTFGGRKAASLEVRHQQAGGVPMRGIIYGVLRNTTSVMVELWSPVDQDEVWAPLIDRVRRRFTFTD